MEEGAKKQAIHVGQGRELRRLLSQRSSASHGTPGHRRVNANVARVPCVAFVSDRQNGEQSKQNRVFEVQFPY